MISISTSQTLIENSFPRADAPKNRRGAIAVETAVVGGVFLIFLISLLQLANLILIYNSMSSAARVAVREAIVRGNQTQPPKTSWGPVRVQQQVNGNHEVSALLRRNIWGIKPSQVQVVVEWPSGTNQTGDDVSVTLTANQVKLPVIIRWLPALTIRTKSTMRIMN